MSSPGAERPLKKEKDFQQAVGKQVAIKTYEPIDGEKMFEGKMLSYDGTTITLLLTIKTRKNPNSNGQSCKCATCCYVLVRRGSS